MTQIPNIEIKFDTESLPGRRAYFKITLINHDNRDYCIKNTQLFDPHGGEFSIDRSQYHTKDWQQCEIIRTYGNHVRENYHIKANEILDKGLYIITKCEFLESEPQGEYWLKYDCGKTLRIMDESCTNLVGIVHKPIVELPFELIDEEEL